MQDNDLKRFLGLIDDLNTTEIMSHVEDNTLEQWLNAIKTEITISGLSFWANSKLMQEVAIYEIQSNNK